MAIETTCGGCGKLLSVGDENVGRRARCPACGQIYTIPSPTAAIPPVPQTLSPTLPTDSTPLAESTAGNIPAEPVAQPTANLNQYWMRATDGAEYGPVDRGTLDRWFAEGRVGPGYVIRQSEVGMWQEAEIVKPGPIPNLYTTSGSTNPYAAVAPTTVLNRGPMYQKPDQSALVLSFGILSWVLCPIFGIVAWVMGKAGLRDIALGLSDPANKGIMLFGYYLGMVHIILVSLCLGGYLVIVALMLASSV